MNNEAYDEENVVYCQVSNCKNLRCDGICRVITKKQCGNCNYFDFKDDNKYYCKKKSEYINTEGLCDNYECIFLLES